MFSDEIEQAAKQHYPRKLIVPSLLILFAINLVNLIINIFLLKNSNTNESLLGKSIDTIIMMVKNVGTIVMIVVLSVIIGFLLLILLFGNIFYFK